TTETGYARAQELYANAADITLVRYPLDFTFAIVRLLNAMRPGMVVLMELEAWPNFVRQCVKRWIPVVLINGRLTESSFRHSRYIKPVATVMFRRLKAICVQDRTYADRFVQLGAPPEIVKMTGTMKFDTAEIAASIAGAEKLGMEVGLRALVPVEQAEAAYV